jgi:hypothetical protein
MVECFVASWLQKTRPPSDRQIAITHEQS